jgi:hypothetical protein
MRLPTKEELIQKLKPLGFEAAKIAADPATLEKAIQRTYKLIPIPWRWFVGRKRIEKLLRSASAAAAKVTTKPDIAINSNLTSSANSQLP